MKILITGAAGFIGSHMTEHLHFAGHEVIGIDNFSDYYDPGLKYRNAAILEQKGIQISSLDLCNSDLQEYLTSELDYIFHFAAQPGISPTSTFSQYLNNNIVSIQKLLEFVENCPHLKMFVNIGTSSVYGVYATGDEKSLPKPVSNYGVTKLAAEHMVLSKARLGLFNACSLRLYSVYGPRERPDKLFTRLIDAGINQKEFSLYEGSLDHSRSFTYVDDIIEGIMSVIGKETICNGEIFNLGNNRNQTTQQAIKSVEKLLNTRMKIKNMPPRLHDQQYTHANITKAKNLLGFQPRTSLIDGIREQIFWFKSTLSDNNCSFINR